MNSYVNASYKLLSKSTGSGQEPVLWVHHIHPTQLKNWRAVALEGLAGLFEKQDSTAELKVTHEEQLTELYAEIGKLTTQVTWLKKKLQL